MSARPPQSVLPHPVRIALFYEISLRFNKNGEPELQEGEKLPKPI